MAKAVYKGVLKTWKDDRGFGFIEPDNGDKDVFVHISSLKGMARRPKRGDILLYDVEKDAGGKFKAINVSIEGVDKHDSTGKPHKVWLWVLAALLGLVSLAVAAYLNLG